MSNVFNPSSLFFVVTQYGHVERITQTLRVALEERKFGLLGRTVPHQHARDKEQSLWRTRMCKNIPPLDVKDEIFKQMFEHIVKAYISDSK